MSGDRPTLTMTAPQIMAALASCYRDDPDDCTLSVGRWVQHEGEALPKFYARLSIQLGQVRRAACGE
jgi:hypothetical protein